MGVGDRGREEMMCTGVRGQETVRLGCWMATWPLTRCWQDNA